MSSLSNIQAQIRREASKNASYRQLDLLFQYIFLFRINYF